jgi:hypothetical protein
MNTEQLELATKAINAHGIFFKKAVRREIESYRALHVLDEEHPVSFPDQTAIDLLLEYPGRSRYRFVLVVECKRAYAVNKCWVFFQERTEQIKAAYFIGGGKHTAITVVPGRFDLEPHSEGIEIDLSKLPKTVDAAYKLGNCDTIHRAASQVCRGFLGFISTQPEQAPKDPNGAPSGPFLAVPVIITNATLYSCQNDYAEINLETGNLNSPLKLEKQRWVLLRHPYSEVFDQGFSDFRLHDAGDAVTPEQRAIFFKEAVLVVNSSHLKEFLLQCPIFSLTPQIT